MSLAQYLARRRGWIWAPPYDAAVGWLLEAGALERDKEIDRLHANVAGNPEAFRITAGGIDLLQQTG